MTHTLSRDEIKRIADEMWRAPILPEITNQSIGSYYVAIDNGESQNNQTLTAVTTTTGDTGVTTWIYPDSGTVTIPDYTYQPPYPPWTDQIQIAPFAQQFPFMDGTPQLREKVQELENKIIMLEAIIREHLEKTKPLVEEAERKRSVIIERDE